MNNGELSFFEIHVDDAERAQNFYGGLFGWQFEKGNFPGYFMIPNASPLGGLDASGGETHPRVFFDVQDMESAVARVRELGGEADEPQEIPSGFFSRCYDDQGTHFTLWQSKDEGQAS